MTARKSCPVANTDKAKYDAGKAQAKELFQKAKGYATEAQSLEPANEDVKAMVTQIDTELAK